MTSRNRLNLFVAIAYFAVLVVAVVADADSWLWFVYAGALVAGLLTGTWISVTIAFVVAPAATVGAALSNEPVGDAGSSVLDTGLIALGFFVVPAAIVIALGVAIRRLVGHRRRQVITD